MLMLMLIIFFLLEQIQMQKWCLSHQKHCWNQIVMYVRSATKDSKGTKICRCIEEGIKYHGNYSREKHQLLENEFLFVLNQLVCTMILVMLQVILLVSKNILEENIVIINNGFVKDVPKVMQCNLIIKLISKLVVLEVILVIAVASSQGNSFVNSFIPNPSFDSSELSENSEIGE